MRLTEKTLKSDVKYKGKILNLLVDEVILPNEKTAKREVVIHSGGSAVYCEKEDKILFVKQFRYPYKEEIYEIPAGKVNANETPEETAIRELEEECGLICKKAEKIYSVYPSPGYTNEIIHIFKASDVSFCKQNLDEDEFLQVFWIEKEKVLEMIENGEIKDAKTVIAVLSQNKKGK